MKSVSSAMLDELVRAARATPRLRINHNLHPALEDPVQRFFNCLEPGSYVRPHRHLDPPRWEVFVALRGRATVLTFDDRGTVMSRSELSPQGPEVAVEIDGGTWHTVVPLHSATVLFELKPGPYSPIADKDFAGWAPPEGHRLCARAADWFGSARVGDRTPESLSSFHVER
jgi:cupin fold WbuC family metalloprotein